MNCAFNWVEKEKDGKRKIENGKIGFFLSLVWWKIGWVNFFRGPKTILPNLEKKWVENVSYV